MKLLPVTLIEPVRYEKQKILSIIRGMISEV